jgi:predicted transcriptional regulator YheO
MTFRKKAGDDDVDVGPSKKVTGRELTLSEEVSTRLDTLVELLQDKGIINKKEYESRVAMHLHEISKATAFEETDEEL